ncbi:hypothetical protein HYV88_02900 [Candidatus Woesearchaeota archaeon]|nr:hypothetical protein [Candidatus Woesearchaeota archaeon]
MKIQTETSKAIKISNRERHVRWNWEISPEYGLVRYHIVVIDDKSRETTIERLLEQMQKYGFVERIRRSEGKVIGTDYRYLFESYDTPIAPREIDFSKTRKPVKQDQALRERKKGNIEDYVSRIYEN